MTITRKRFFERIKGNREEYWIVYRDDNKVFQAKGHLRDYQLVQKFMQH